MLLYHHQNHHKLIKMDYMKPTREKNELQNMFKKLQRLLIIFMGTLVYAIYTELHGYTTIWGVLLLLLTGYWCFIQIPAFSGAFNELDDAYWGIVKYYEAQKHE